MDAREAAWGRLHDPATPAADLAAIARAHPEFADAIARHPNCYPELRVWAEQTVGREPAPEALAAHTEAAEAEQVAEETPAGTRSRRGVLIAAAVGGVLVLGGGGAALAAVMSGPGVAGPPPSVASAEGEQPTPAPTASASTGKRRLDGPPVYIGDELSMFLLDGDELAPFVPAAASGEVSSALKVLGEGEGASALPVVCTAWILPDESAVIGSRSLKWNTSGFTDDAMTVRQFPTPEFADAWYSDYADHTEECARFEFGQIGISSRAQRLEVVARHDDDVLVVVMNGDDTEYARTVLVGHDGNVVLSIDAEGALAPGSAQQLADVVGERIADARASLTETIGYR